MSRLKIAFPYLVFFGMTLVVVWSNLKPHPTHLDLAAGAKTIDPVCRMEVNVHWDITYKYEDQTYYFCTERCQKMFAEDPKTYLVERCMVCNKPLVPENSLSATYMDRTYFLCCEEHRQQFKADPARYFMHRMWGIPDWLYFVSIGIILMVSFGIFEGAKRLRKPTLTGNKNPENTQVTSADIAAGLFGHQNPALNIAPILTWTIWWCGLVVLIMFAGKAWCYMCPWDAIATWMERLRFWKKTDQGLGLHLPWPRWFRNITIATVFFVGLTWIELGFRRDHDPPRHRLCRPDHAAHDHCRDFYF